MINSRRIAGLLILVGTAVYDFLTSVLESDNRGPIDPGIEEFTALDIRGAQAGILSPILPLVHPTTYPTDNKRRRNGKETSFGYEMSRKARSYVPDLGFIRQCKPTRLDLVVDRRGTLTENQNSVVNVIVPNSIDGVS